MSHAIVMGGSIAGMCAAAALARNFDHVTILERDANTGLGCRRGVPQGHHAHALLRRGKEIIDELLPGCFEGLARDGAVCRDLGTSWRWFHFGSWKAAAPLGIDIYYQTRPLLDFHARRVLLQNPKITLRCGAAVEEPLHADGLVRGVRLRDGEILEADLVVDATGRGSRSNKWLERWGYGPVSTDRVHIGLGYTSAIFELAEGESVDEAIAIYRHGDSKRSGTLLPTEGGRMMATMMGYHNDHAPAELEGFLDWSASLSSPDIYEKLKNARLVGTFHRFKTPSQQRHRYDKLWRLPNRYLIIGDAMCSLDPSFGQGMTIATLECERLATLRPGQSTRRIQRQLCRLTAVPFSLTSTEAFRMPETRGQKPALSTVQARFLGWVYAAANNSPEVYQQLMRVMHCVAPPASLAHPRMLQLIFGSQKRARPLVRASAQTSLVGELSASPLTQTGF